MTGQRLSAIKYSDACSVRSLYGGLYVKLSANKFVTMPQKARRKFSKQKNIDYGIASYDSP